MTYLDDITFDYSTPDIITIDENVLLSKLINGDYHSKSSNSDSSRIQHNIKRFIKYLPSFKSITDDLNPMVLSSKLLLKELIEYYKHKTTLPSPCTFETDITAILRLLFIATKDKSTPIYIEFKKLSKYIRDVITDKENKQRLDNKETKSFVNFNVIIDRYKELKKVYDDEGFYKNNQNLVIVALYRFLPERNELKLLKFSEVEDDNDDIIYIKDPNNVFLYLNKNKKNHDKLHINLSEEYKELADILYDSYKTYPRTYLITNYSNPLLPCKLHQASVRLNNLFKFTGKAVGVNSIRSSYLSHLNDSKTFSISDKKKVAKILRTSVDCIDRHYIKLNTNSKKDFIINLINNISDNKYDDVITYLSSVN